MLWESLSWRRHWSFRKANKAGKKQRQKGNHDRSLKIAEKGRKDCKGRGSGAERQFRDLGRGSLRRIGWWASTLIAGSRCHHAVALIWCQELLLLCSSVYFSHPDHKISGFTVKIFKKVVMRLSLWRKLLRNVLLNFQVFGDFPVISYYMYLGEYPWAWKEYASHCCVECSINFYQILLVDGVKFFRVLPDVVQLLCELLREGCWSLQL